MSIEKRFSPLIPDDPDLNPEVAVALPPATEEEAVVTETEDGGALVDLSGGEEEKEVAAFGDNLAEGMAETELQALGSSLRAAFDADLRSRKDWESIYKEGIALLGFTMEERDEPWAGACGVTHPLLAEAVVRFQAETITDIFPAAGPVKTNVVGSYSDPRISRAARVRDYMNFTLTSRMPEYRAETERLLFGVGFIGSGFRKWYWDARRGRPVGVYVPAEDFVVAYDTTNLEVAERYTHIVRPTPDEAKHQMANGMYRTLNLDAPAPDYSEVREAKDKVSGQQPAIEVSNRHKFLEMHVEMAIDGINDDEDLSCPYVVTVDFTSSQVLSIRRNWKENDLSKKKVMHFVDWGYVPGFGFYNFGLVHLIGGMAKAATSLTRQLVDAGTLSNLPGGLKSRGLRIKNDDSPIMPGEWRDVDVAGGTIKDNLIPLPYKEPSAVLLNLMTGIIEEGRKFASMAEMSGTDMNQQAQVGTTLAILERSLKVISAVKARLHNSLTREFALLVELIKDNDGPDYPYEVDEAAKLSDDFNDTIDVIPVSDPNASSMAYRVLQYQSAMALSKEAPQLYDHRVLHVQMLETLGLPGVNRIIPPDETLVAMDPVTENSRFVTKQPVKAFPHQDHEAHIRTHMALATDPRMAQMAQQSPEGNAVMAAIDAHTREHIAFEYRRQIEQALGIELPPLGMPMPEDIEVRLSGLIAEAAEMVKAKNEAANQQAKNKEAQEDPIIQMRMKELQQKDEDLKLKAKDLDSKIRERAAKVLLEKERISSSERIAGAQLGNQVASKMLAATIEQERISAENKRAGVQAGVTIAAAHARPKPGAK